MALYYPIIQIQQHYEKACSEDFCLLLYTLYYCSLNMLSVLAAELTPVDLESERHIAVGVAPFVLELAERQLQRQLLLAVAFWQTSVVVWNLNPFLFHLNSFWSKPKNKGICKRSLHAA